MIEDDNLEQNIIKKIKAFTRIIDHSNGLQAKKEQKIYFIVKNLTQAVKHLSSSNDHQDYLLKMVRHLSKEMEVQIGLSPKVYQATLDLLKVLIKFYTSSQDDPKLCSEADHLMRIVGGQLFGRSNLCHVEELFEKLQAREPHKDTNGWALYSCLKSSIKKVNDGSVLALLYQEFLNNNKKSTKYELKARVLGMLCSLLGVPLALSTDQVLPEPSQVAGETRYQALKQLLTVFCHNTELQTKELSSVFSLLEKEQGCPDLVCSCLQLLLQCYPGVLAPRAATLVNKCLTASTGFQEEVPGVSSLLLTLTEIFQKKSEMPHFHNTLMKRLEVASKTGSLHIKKLPSVLRAELVRKFHLLPDKHQQDIWRFLNGEVSKLVQDKLSDWMVTYLHIVVDSLCIHMNKSSHSKFFQEEVSSTRELVANFLQMDPLPAQLITPHLQLWESLVSRAHCKDLDLEHLRKLLDSQPVDLDGRYLGLQILMATSPSPCKTTGKLLTLLEAQHPPTCLPVGPDTSGDLPQALWTLWLQKLDLVTRYKPKLLEKTVRQVLDCGLSSEGSSPCLELFSSKFITCSPQLSALFSQIFQVFKECFQAPKRKSTEMTDLPTTVLEALATGTPDFHATFTSWIQSEGSNTIWRLDGDRLSKLLQLLETKKMLANSKDLASRTLMGLLVLLPSARKSQVAQLLYHMALYSGSGLPYSLIAGFIFDQLLAKSHQENNSQLFNQGIEILAVLKDHSKPENFISSMVTKLQAVQSPQLAEQMIFLLYRAAQMLPTAVKESVTDKLAGLYSLTVQDLPALWCSQACLKLSALQDLSPILLQLIEASVKQLPKNLVAQLCSAYLLYLQTILKKRYPAALTMDSGLLKPLLEDEASPTVELQYEEESLLSTLIANLPPESQGPLLDQLITFTEEELEIGLVLLHHLVPQLPPEVFSPRLYPMLEKCRALLPKQPTLSLELVAHFYRPLALLVAEAMKDPKFPAVNLLLELCMPTMDLPTAPLRPRLALGSHICSLLTTYIHHAQASHAWISASVQLLFSSVLKAGDQTKFVALPEELQEMVSQAADEIMELCGLIGSEKSFKFYVNNLVSLYPLSARESTLHPVIREKIQGALASLLGLDNNIAKDVGRVLPPGAREVLGLLCEDIRRLK